MYRPDISWTGFRWYFSMTLDPTEHSLNHTTQDQTQVRVALSGSRGDVSGAYKKQRYEQQ